MCELQFNRKKHEIEHENVYNNNCELKHLVKVKITGISGSSPELKLIEYLLSIASKLEKLEFECCLDPKPELEVTRDLLEFPRASPNAKLICLNR